MERNTLEVWFVTGSQHLYGPAALAQVAENSRQVVAGLNASSALPLPVVFKPVVTTPESILAVCREANAAPQCAGLICWMHTFSPAKMWIGGLAALDKPMLHLHTQFNRDLPWATIDMDFMNLNQAAHGDREFGYICTRMRKPRKVVVGHWQEPDVHQRLAAWMRAAAGLCEMRNLKVARLGDNMRQVAVTEGDKVEAQIRLGVQVNGYGVGDLVKRIGEVADADIDRVVAEYDAQYAMAQSLRPGGDRREALRYAAPSRIGAAGVSRQRRGQGLYRYVRGLVRPGPTAGLGGPASDGRRLRVRRRRRLEDGGPGAGRQDDGRRLAGRDVVHGGLHVPSRSRRAEGARRAHARSLPLAGRGRSPRAKSIRWASAARPIPCGWSSRPPRVRRSTSR